ncbi:ion channel [Flavihumibacter fluvii]|uniref:ion channel n=1 Tax=Flavihumibacter fluvii TaxID=2838157 RepID=UPI001BDE4878|nr:ion channel [Flavihumibacter fluvii]ULQ52045.1 ion channel [Flavihumibacter fluvii]
MAFRKPNRKAQVNNETGLGTNTALSGGRFFNRDGNPNMEVRGMKLFQRLNIYHALLTMPQWKFLLFVVLFFLGINLVFAGIYTWIGIENLGGLVANSALEKFGETYFFSAQTFTTVGYGRINPIGFAASLTASLEALTGLMSFAVVTGLIYGRFARPRAFIRYSKYALFVPFRDGVAMMFRMVPYTRNYLVNVEVRGTLALRLQEDGQVKTRFYNIPFDISKANTMTANWTLVHMINDESPFYGFTREDFKNAMAEVLIFVQGFDESFSNTVVSRSSYTFEEFVYGAKFRPMFHPSDDNSRTILHLDKLDDFEPVPLPADHLLNN